MNQIGIMQGRLSPMLDNKIQAFPIHTWQEEFQIAKSIGFKLIEWVVDTKSIDINPIFSNDGRQKIKNLQNETLVKVESICCDNFVDLPLTEKDRNQRKKSFNVFCNIINIAPTIGIKFIELPLIGNASIQQNDKRSLFLDILGEVDDLILANDIKILIETDLNPVQISELLQLGYKQNYFFNYDTGNSTFWGFDTKKEFEIYGDKIGNVHIKDCTPEKYSVPLGEGDTDFNEIMKLLMKKKYKGDFILQTARSSPNKDLEVAKEYFLFTKMFLDKYLSE